jgi:hypothetical protein
VDQQTFDKWSIENSDFPYLVQYHDKTIVVSKMLPPHDGAAGIIVHGISRAVDRNCYPVEQKVVMHTGCLNLE